MYVSSPSLRKALTMRNKELLNELKRAKAVVQQLEDDYRKVCECNDRLDGSKRDFAYTDKVISYSTMKVYKTCEHHKVRYVQR